MATARDIAFNGSTGQRVDQVLANPYGNKTLNNYLNPAACAYPAPGQLGTHRRASIEGPAYWAIDLAVSKLIAFAGSRSVELRVEAFNLLNNFNWGLPQTNYDQGNFGRITSTGGDPRIMQFGVKATF